MAELAEEGLGAARSEDQGQGGPGKRPVVEVRA